MTTTPFETQVLRMREPGAFFAARGPVHIARAPGRLDLMGGNDDYTGGLVFEATIREATWAAAQVQNDGRVRLSNPQMAPLGWQDVVELDLEALDDEDGVRRFANRSEKVRWTAYALGVLHYLRRTYPDRVKTGLTVHIESEVPLNKGVSSSAAIEVAVMKAAASAYGIPLEGVALAEACQWAENVVAQSACGIMDQITSVLGDEDCILPLVCQPCIPEPLIRLPEDLACWAVDSGVSHEVSGIEYEAARAAAFMGYKLICDWENLPVELDESGQIPRYVDSRWNGYLANVLPSLFRSKFETQLPESMTGTEYLLVCERHVDPFTACRPEHPYRVRANTRYAVEENARVQTFSELARGAGHTRSERAYILMGEQMYQSHFGYTECGLGSKATDLLVDLAREEGPANGIYGAKITGGGAGGTVAILGRRDAEASFRRIVERYGEKRGFTPYVFEGSSMGADRFGVRILEA
jgi:L-arabinokinase